MSARVESGPTLRGLKGHHRKRGRFLCGSDRIHPGVPATVPVPNELRRAGSSPGCDLNAMPGRVPWIRPRAVTPSRFAGRGSPRAGGRQYLSPGAASSKGAAPWGGAQTSHVDAARRGGEARGPPRTRPLTPVPAPPPGGTGQGVLVRA